MEDGPAWSREDDVAFEKALVDFPDGTAERWRRVAEVLPGRSPEEVRWHYELLVRDVLAIELGLIPSPSYSVDVADKQAQASSAAAEGGGGRKKGKPWTEEEHKLFLHGLKEYEKGDWRSISRHFVKTRSPTQVASHAQKYFKRQSRAGNNKVNRRSSIHDTTIEDLFPNSTQTTSTDHNIIIQPDIPPDQEGPSVHGNIINIDTDAEIFNSRGSLVSSCTTDENDQLPMPNCPYNFSDLGPSSNGGTNLDDFPNSLSTQYCNYGGSMRIINGNTALINNYLITQDIISNHGLSKGNGTSKMFMNGDFSSGAQFPQQGNSMGYPITNMGHSNSMGFVSDTNGHFSPRLHTRVGSDMNGNMIHRPDYFPNNGGVLMGNEDNSDTNNRRVRPCVRLPNHGNNVNVNGSNKSIPPEDDSPNQGSS